MVVDNWTIVAGTGVEPVSLGYEPSVLPLHQPSIARVAN